MTVDEMLKKALELLRTNPEVQDVVGGWPDHCSDPDCEICPWVEEVIEFLSALGYSVRESE